MKNYRIQLLNTFYDNLSMVETIERVRNAIESHMQIHHTVINANKVVLLQNDSELRRSVNSADLINIDGKGVLWAAKLLGKPVKERVTGIDLMMECLNLCQKKGYKAYFFGAKEEVVLKLINKISKDYGENIVAGYRNGYFSPEQEEIIVEDIRKSNPQMLFVAVPSPKKENFLYQNKNEFKNVNFIMGVGGSFDVIAGKVKRAPSWMQKFGLEWLYRLIQEPKKMWKRYLIGNFLFASLVIKHKLCAEN
ncbi:MAG: WecB/TagA/CpsF family glycosyltransferase [Weeksellaceae bacterium]|nr:WecB/TagA/CpsF family glycosyltransferase [Weeksellaceae bacterium]